MSFDDWKRGNEWWLDQKPTGQIWNVETEVTQIQISNDLVVSLPEFDSSLLHPQPRKGHEC